MQIVWKMVARKRNPRGNSKGGRKRKRNWKAKRGTENKRTKIRSRKKIRKVDDGKVSGGTEKRRKAGEIDARKMEAETTIKRWPKIDWFF